MSFGKTLIQLRESKGLSQYEVAEKLGIKRAR
ncbi:helix-turn-helix domain-containing protein, partial [Paenibacillus larvae]